MFRAFVLLSLFFTISNLNAQTIVTGKVTDDVQTAISFATVSLHANSNPNPVAATLSDSSGLFVLNNILPGKYSLRASFLGYLPGSSQVLVSDGQAEVRIGEIVLKQDTMQLAEVVVRGDRSAIRYEPLKMVIQVAGNDVFKSSANVMDILRKAPGLTVNPDGTLLVSGLNTPAVFINGKPTPMSPEELLAYLNGLAPELIEAIDVIANPSSRYDGQYKAIIDIKLRNDQSRGWLGNLTSSSRQNAYFSTDNSLNLSYKSNKVTYGLRAGYVAGDDYYRYNALQRLASKNYMATRTQTRTSNNNLALQLSTDYTINKHQSLELSARIYQANRTRNGINTLTFRDSLDKNITGINQTTNLAVPRQNNHALNLAYHIHFARNLNLVVFGTISGFDNRQTEDIQIRDALKDTLNSYWKTTLKNDIRIRTIQADFTQTVGKVSWEAGGKFAYVRTDNDLRYDTLGIQQEFVADAGRTNYFVYDEYVSAAYAAYGYKPGKLDLRMSVRAEHTRTIANSVTSSEVLKRNYITWLPGASATYAFSQMQSASLILNRRITRPSFGQLNPFRFYLSPLNYTVGNPYLRPSVTTSLTLNYNYKDFTISINAGRERDLMARYPEYNRETNELLYLGMNLPYGDFAGLESGYNRPISKWWKTTHNVGVHYIKQQMPYLGETYAIGVADFTVNGSHVFNLPKAFIVDLTYRYVSKGGNSLYIRKPTGSVDIGIQKTWLKGALNSKLNAYDLFYTNPAPHIFREKQIIDNQLVHRFGTRRLVLTLAYNFGRSNYKTKQNRTSDEEQRTGQ